MFKNTLFLVLHKCWQLAAFLLISLAVLISIARYMMPDINNYRETIEELITKSTGIKVSIGKIEGNWESLGPYIKISNVRLGSGSNNKSDRVSTIKSITMSIATFPTIFYRTLISEHLTIDGLLLHIEQKKSTGFILPNITKINEAVTDINPIFAASIQDWLQHQTNVLLTNTQLDIQLHNGIHYPIRLDQIHFAKGKNIYQLSGLSYLPGGNRIDFVLEVDGFLTDPDSIGQLYINTHKINMHDLPLNAVWKEAKINSGELELELWAEWKNQHFDSAQISLNIDNFQMSLANQLKTKLNKLSTYLLWKRQSEGWQLESQQTEIITQGRVAPDPSLQVRMHDIKPYQHYEISASRLDVGIWTDLILTTPNLEEDLRKQLLIMQPNGFIDNSLINVDIENGQLINFRAHATFSELTWKPWRNIPGVSNIAGQFEIHKDKGIVLLDSQHAVIDYTPMFRWPFKINRITSRFSWELSNPQIKLQINNLSLELPEAELLVDGVFDIDRNSGLVNINLYAEIMNVDIAKIKHFLPIGLMSAHLVDYLDKSIKSGNLHSSQIAIRGADKHFPFSNSHGVFAVNAELNDTNFIFAEDWPELTDISADLWFVENNMDIKIFHGKSQGQKIMSASVTIDDLLAESLILKVKTFSQGDFADGIDYINHSPLKSSVGTVFEIIPTSGPFSLSLDLTIPLDDDQQKIEVDGKIHLQGNSMFVQSINLAIENIHGDVVINNSLVSSDNLIANLFDGISHFSLQQQLDSKGLLSTLIKSTGNLSTHGIKKVFPQWLPSKVEGHTRYQTTLLLPEVTPLTDIVMDLTITSNLDGISSTFPAPFGKKPNKNETFIFNYQILNNDQYRIAASLSNRVDIKLQSSAQTSVFGQLVFGGGKARISGQKGIELTGRFDEFILQSWLELLHEQSETSQDSFFAADYKNIFVNDLSIASLNYYFMDFKEVNISAKSEDKVLHISLSSDDISGRISIPDGNLNLPINIHLQSLKITDPFQISSDSNGLNLPITSSSTIDDHTFTRPLPPINIRCEECIYNGTTLGSTEINISPLEKGNSFTINNKSDGILGMEIKGNWGNNANAQVVTTLTGEISTDKLGEFLALFNHQTGIHGTPLKTKGDLSWLGDPMQFNYQSLNGKVTINGGKGSQEDLSDKSARIFSLFSIGSLARKLTLDFSDLFSNGFFYSSMEGNFTISEGVFTTTDFAIEGTAADVEIKGFSDFPNNRIENCVLVTPNLSSSLPVLAGWAIEPVTGLLVYLVSKVFQPALKVITSIQYQIEGPFENPVITEIGKSEGTVTIGNSAGENRTTITTNPEQPSFSCKGTF